MLKQHFDLMSGKNQLSFIACFIQYLWTSLLLGCFTVAQTKELVSTERKVNRDNALQSLTKTFSRVYRTFTFQHDSDVRHTAKTMIVLGVPQTLTPPEDCCSTMLNIQSESKSIKKNGQHFIQIVHLHINICSISTTQLRFCV